MNLRDSKNSIRILKEDVASQIAAGEVVERPASVVRELIDNSIDAGAEKIVLAVESGGRKSIRVTDSGMGMSRDDLLLSIERHATSKIESIDDLSRIRSLGFRGEALPSIASVSRLTIRTRRAGDISGNTLKINGGKLISIEETGSPEGTMVEVRDLFFNTPARKKFLKSARTESDHIMDAVEKASIPHRNISFRLDMDGRNSLSIPATEDYAKRLFFILGRRVTESMIELDENSGDLSIRAFLAPPELSRKRWDRLYCYVNGRYIRDRLISRAVMEGYGRRLMKGQYPQVVIFLDIDPSTLDVNVHPAKQEIRFSGGNLVFRKISSAIDSALSGAFSFPSAEQETTVRSFAEAGKQPEVSEPRWEYFENLPLEGAGQEEFSFERRGLSMRILGQLAKTYILCQNRSGLLIVDQHAAHERIVYETLRKGFRGSEMAVQNLLIPLEIELNRKDAARASRCSEDLQRLGICLDHFGGDTFLLRSMPLLLSRVDWNGFLPELLEQMEGGRMENDEILDRVLTVMACHAAIKAGDELSSDEMNGLFAELEEMELPTNCPHGRPVFKRFSFYEIEKMFKRVV